MYQKEGIKAKSMIPKHHLYSFLHRGLYSLGSVGFILFLGTACLHFIEGFSYVDAFYFTSMIATGQGPASTISPVTVSGKLFTCFLAFISVGVMVASLGFLFGPFLGKLWKVGITKFEEELQHFHKDK